MADQSGSPLGEANTRIREAAKWLMASAAAVGAALIAGSQLSNIGQLSAHTPDTVEHARLWVATAGVVVGLTAVTYMIWTAVQLFLPHTVVIGSLVTHWSDRSGEMARVARFFKDHGKYLQGYDTPADLVAHRVSAVQQLAAGDAGTDSDADAAIVADLDTRIGAVEDMAAHLLLKERFVSCLKRLLAGTAVAAVGIIAFSWAANPPSSSPAADLRSTRLIDADLKGADLRNAQLDGADLTGADLTGADLTGASTVGTIWRATTCPDGRNSDDVGKSCRGHLQPS